MSNGFVKPIGEPRERYRGRLLRIVDQDVQFGDGTVKTFERAERAPGVRVLVSYQQRILLTKEFRSEQAEFDFRLPGGKVFDSVAEFVSYVKHTDANIVDVARSAAKKELFEETTLDVDENQFTLFHRSVCGATVLWDLYYFVVHVAGGQEFFEKIATHEGEVLEPMWVLPLDAMQMCLNGNIKEDRSVSVLLRFLLTECPSTARP